MGFAIAVAGVLVGLVGLGVSAAGIYYTATDWGSSDTGEKAKVYALLISGIILLALAIAGMAYWLFKTPPKKSIPIPTKKKK